MTAASAPTLAIVGAGTWGTALAQAAARAGREVLLWDRDPAIVRAITEDRRSPRAFPDLELEPGIRAEGDLATVLACEVVLLVVPAQAIRGLCRSVPGARPGVVVVCAKGFESTTDELLSAVVEAEWPGTAVACLSGPSFAAEVASGLPTALTLGAVEPELGARLAELLSGPHLRVYWTDDRAGVEIGGAVKNVLAIASGMVTGAGLGENARAALVTRGLAELARLGAAMGARAETLMGLAGLGDLMLTAMSATSRNTAFGMALGQGRSVAEAGAGGALVEGFWTARAVDRLATRHGVETPIARAVARILDGRLGIDEALATLMHRPLRAEGLA
ncbi:MAG: NAD(P)-dependent glycerol-3-phosphate dehydrogenase [Geminicoccaceae bacterium]|jgi:glycerol-3-phosphate dehydrogenase (NAD(P)+)|nr:NAD(P)-dependent glycerol-3-phosphate dehydrogenase [Geminicoccaceae bacterium]